LKQYQPVSATFVLESVYFVNAGFGRKRAQDMKRAVPCSPQRLPLN
jgi:hypothetical protein